MLSPLFWQRETHRSRHSGFDDQLAVQFLAIGQRELPAVAPVRKARDPDPTLQVGDEPRRAHAFLFDPGLDVALELEGGQLYCEGRNGEPAGRDDLQLEIPEAAHLHVLELGLHPRARIEFDAPAVVPGCAQAIVALSELLEDEPTTSVRMLLDHLHVESRIENRARDSR